LGGHFRRGYSWGNTDRGATGVRDRAARKLGRLRNGKPEAEAADRKAFADALIAGKGKPKKSEAAQLEAQVASEHERVAALDLAVKTVRADLLRLARRDGAAKRAEIVSRLPEYPRSRRGYEKPQTPS
jgi:hypothetical protein